MRKTAGTLPLVVVPVLVLIAAQLAAAEPTKRQPTTPEGEAVVWYDGDRPMVFRRSPAEVAVVGRSPSAARAAGQALFPGARVVHEVGGAVHLALPGRLTPEALATARSVARGLPEIRVVSPVYRQEGQADGSRGWVLSGEILVGLAPDTGTDEARAWGTARGVELVGELPVAGLFRYACVPDDECLETANRLRGEPGARFASPDWYQPLEPRAFTPDDPLYAGQWHLRNVGQSGGTAGEDVDVLGAWADHDGTGITIAVVDDGVDRAHEDLAANELVGWSWNYLLGNNQPTPGTHGTACAGVAAAVGGNGLGVTGAAPAASFVDFNLLTAASTGNQADAMTRNEAVVDIRTNSWGPSDNGTGLVAAPFSVAQALKSGVSSGRDGKGTIYVWAGGNGRTADDDVNADGYASSRYTIAVGATDHDGNVSWYSETGASLHVNAPSSGDGVGITTTDRTGSAGYDPGAYTDGFGGTSSATPLVAGIVALVLDANPELSWRDVQAILVTTAERNDPTDPGWVQNGAGYWYHHDYGFGRVDAAAAVAAAATWQPATPELSYGSPVLSVGAAVPDSPGVNVPGTPVVDTFEVLDRIAVESVQVVVNATHTYRGDLAFELISPSGTESLMLHSRDGDSQDTFFHWPMTSTHFFGEDAQGEWTLRVTDNWIGDTGTLIDWQLIVHGTPVPPPAISIADAAITEGDAGTSTLQLTVSLSSAPLATVTVDYATGDGTATAGSDYVAASGTLSFQPGGPLAKTIGVTVNGDGAIEGDETFRVILSNPSGAGAYLADNEATATILNDDEVPCTVADDTLLLSGLQVAGPAIYEACDRIDASTVVVQGTGALTLRAGSTVVLHDGFRVESGGGLVIAIETP